MRHKHAHCPRAGSSPWSHSERNFAGYNQLVISWEQQNKTKQLLQLYQRPGKRRVASRSCWERSESWPAVEFVGVGARFGMREMLLVLFSTAHAAANALGLFMLC